MPLQIGYTGHQLPIGSDPSPVRFGLLPGVSKKVHRDVVNNMVNGDRLMVSEQKSPMEHESARRHYRFEAPFAVPFNRRLIPGARGPVRPIEWGVARRITEARGNFPPAPVHLGGRYVEFK